MTTQLNLEDIMLSTNNIQKDDVNCMQNPKKNSEERVERWLSETWEGVGFDQMLTKEYKISDCINISGDIIYSIVTIVNDYITYMYII